MKFLLKQTYLQFLFNSIDSKSYRNSFFEKDGKIIDILKNGDLSCAYYVSSVLKTFDLINNLHATVSGTLNDLLNRGWYEIKVPRKGCVIIWEDIVFPDGENHSHIGFYWDEEMAISNNSLTGQIFLHDMYFRKGILSERKIKSFLWSEMLDY